jgi:hypothetical protein
MLPCVVIQCGEQSDHAVACVKRITLFSDKRRQAKDQIFVEGIATSLE